MYELPLMGHTLVTYCWGGKSQIKRGLKTCLNCPLSTRQDSLYDAVLDFFPLIIPETDPSTNLYFHK